MQAVLSSEDGRFFAAHVRCETQSACNRERNRVGGKIESAPYLDLPAAPLVLPNLVHVDPLVLSPQASRVVEVGAISIDLERRLVTVNDAEIQLTRTEYNLVRTLAKRLGQVLSREVLQSEALGYNFVLDTRAVDTHIGRLRSKLGEANTLIKTVRGQGYKMG